MRRLFWVTAAVLTASLMTRAADPIPKSGDSPLKLPELTGPLDEGLVYALDLDGEVMVQAFPAGLVTVDKQALTGPTRVKATWADTGKFEWRTFKGKTLTTVETIPGSDGVVTLVVVPVAAKSEADWRTVQITLKSGKGPQPPPSTLRADVRAAYDKDSSTGKAALAVKLAKLYRAAGSDEFLKKYGATTTWFEVFTDISTANAAQMGQTDLQGVRTVVSKYLDGRLPTDKKTVLDSKLAASEFGAAAGALEALTK